MTPTIGTVARQAVAAGRPGCVAAAFSRAVYVRFTHVKAIMAITTLDVPSGPLHMRVPTLPEAAVGDAVTVERDTLAVGAHRVLIPTDEWHPPAISHLLERRHVAANVLRQALGETRLLTLAGIPSDVGGVLSQEGLRATLSHLAGRGSGLTPAGDDCAGGILLVTALLRRAGLATWPSSALVELASDHASHEIAVAFLVAAARGEGIEPIHTLLDSCARDDRRAVARDLRVLDGIGHTSGRDTAYGILVGLELADVIAGDWRGVRDRLSSASHSAT